MELSAYLITYGVILLPTVILMTGMSIVLNVLLRNKYLSYVVTVGTCAGLFYLYNLGYDGWIYNPSLFRLWNYADLTGAGNKLGTILTHRLYCLAIASLCLALAHLFFKRKATKGFLVDGRLGGSAWSLLFALVSLATAVVTGRTLLSSLH